MKRIRINRTEVPGVHTFGPALDDGAPRFFATNRLSDAGAWDLFDRGNVETNPVTLLLSPDDLVLLGVESIRGENTLWGSLSEIREAYSEPGMLGGEPENEGGPRRYTERHLADTTARHLSASTGFSFVVLADGPSENCTSWVVVLAG